MQITKENILNKTSSFEILNYYLKPYHNYPNLKEGKNISNPLILPEKQKTPSFNIYLSKNSNEWRYKDFATGDDGSCFDLIMKLNNVEFYDVLKIINNDLSLGLEENNNKKHSISFYNRMPEISNKINSLKDYTINKKSFTASELNYWTKYGIPLTVLEKYGVSALTSFTAINNEGKQYTVNSSNDKYIFAYEHATWVKIYKPLDEKKYRFQYLGSKDQNYLFGFDLLPEKGDLVFLSGGEKDVLSLVAHGFNAFTLNSETASLNTDIVTRLKQRFNKFIVLYDNDQTGLTQSEKLCKEFDLLRIVLPSMIDGKDISDYFSKGFTIDDFNKLNVESVVSKNNIEIIEVDEQDKIVYTAAELMAMDGSEQEYLMKPIFPLKTCAVLAGKPDTGKSQLARQLCIQIANNNPDFLGFNLTPKHKRALYVATEDGMESTKFLLDNQMKGFGCQPTDNLKFVFADTLEQQEIIDRIALELSVTPVDLVVIDSFGDIFKGGDTNNNMAMRNTVKAFDRIAKKYECLILFVHHINKGAYNQKPGQQHIQGGAGLVQKVRLAIQLTQGDSDLKYLTVVKGNYCPREYKENGIELSFSEITFLFAPTGNLIPIDQLGDQPVENQKDEKYDELVSISDAIFNGEILSYGEFVKRYCKATGRSTATAKRKHSDLKKLEIIVDIEGKYMQSDIAHNRLNKDSDAQNKDNKLLF